MQDSNTLALEASWSIFFRGGSGGGFWGSSLSLGKLPQELKNVSGEGKADLLLLVQYLRNILWNIKPNSKQLK